MEMFWSETITFGYHSSQLGGNLSQWQQFNPGYAKQKRFRVTHQNVLELCPLVYIPHLQIHFHHHIEGCHPPLLPPKQCLLHPSLVAWLLLWLPPTTQLSSHFPHQQQLVGLCPPGLPAKACSAQVKGMHFAAFATSSITSFWAARTDAKNTFSINRPLHIVYF